MEVNLPDILSLQPSNSEKLSLRKFTQYLDTILFSIRDTKVCNLSSKFLSDYYITIDFTTFNYKIPVKLNDQLKECQLSNVDLQFYIIPLVFTFEKDSHANVLIIDNYKKTIELYEPHGLITNIHNFDIKTHINNLISIILPKRKHFYFKNVHQVCPIGLQKRQSKVNPKSGHCVAWTLFFINVRLINLFKTSEEIIEYFNTFTDNNIDLLIRKYITLIENQTIVEHKKYTNEYYPVRLSINEMNTIKNKIKEKTQEYFNKMRNNSNLYDIQKIFSEFIIYSKFDFFHEIYFKTIEQFFHR